MLQIPNLLFQVHPSPTPNPVLMYANPSNFKVSECLFLTDRIKQGSQFDVIY